MQLDWVSFALQIVNFLALVWILQRFLYRPVLQAIARRRAAIEQTLADAGARQTQAEALEQQYRDRLGAWEREKADLRAAALAQVEAERAQRMAALQQALDGEREKRLVVEQRQQREQQRRLAEEAAAQGARFAARLLARVAAPEVEARLVGMACEDLAALPEAQREAIGAACREAGGRVRVASAFRLGEDARRALLERLRAVVQPALEADFEQDAGLVAGLRIAIGSWVLRANVRDELVYFAEGAARGD